MDQFLYFLNIYTLYLKAFFSWEFPRAFQYLLFLLVFSSYSGENSVSLLSIHSFNIFCRFYGLSMSFKSVRADFYNYYTWQLWQKHNYFTHIKYCKWYKITVKYFIKNWKEVNIVRYCQTLGILEDWEIILINFITTILWRIVIASLRGLDCMQ